MSYQSKTIHLLCLTLCALSSNGFAMGNADPIIKKIMLDQFEWRDSDGENLLVWDASFHTGKDFNKIAVKSKGEQVDGETTSSELSLLYQRAVSPYWDISLGLRQDLKPTPEKSWMAVGFEGNAPYFINTNISFFFDESKNSALRLRFEKELMITQKLLISPELELNLYGHNDIKTGTGSGLADAEFGIRLLYEITREFAPYIGVSWEKSFAQTASFKRAAGEHVSETQFLVGIRAWF